LKRPELESFCYGALMTAGGALTLVATKRGISGRIAVADLVLLRYIVAGAIALPLVGYYGFRSLAGHRIASRDHFASTRWLSSTSAYSIAALTADKTNE
jgi:hypothetical protein